MFALYILGVFTLLLLCYGLSCDLRRWLEPRVIRWIEERLWRHDEHEAAEQLEALRASYEAADAEKILYAHQARCVGDLAPTAIELEGLRFYREEEWR